MLFQRLQLVSPLLIITILCPGQSFPTDSWCIQSLGFTSITYLKQMWIHYCFMEPNVYQYTANDFFFKSMHLIVVSKPLYAGTVKCSYSLSTNNGNFSYRQPFHFCYSRTTDVPLFYFPSRLNLSIIPPEPLPFLLPFSFSCTKERVSNTGPEMFRVIKYCVAVITGSVE